MATNFQAVDTNLEKIKTTLQGISSSLASSTPEQRTQLEGTLKTLGGALSSEQARRSVENAKTSSPGTTPSATTPTTDALTKAMQDKAAAETRAKEAEARKKEAEATASIADQRLAQRNAGKTGTTSGLSNSDATANSGVTTLEGLLAQEPELANYGLTADNVSDPMVVATLRNQVARSQQLEADYNRLNEMVAKKEERTKEQVALINTSIKNQEAQLKVEQRKRMASEGMAGVLSGRSLYSPEEHQGLIQEVVQDGILKLQEIQIEGFKLKNEMWDNFDNYEFEKYTKKSEVLKEYNKLELDTVTAIQTHLQNIAKTQQEKIVFDQQQMDRSSLILAGELVGASDATIRETATANGVDYGLLKKAVEDANYEQQSRALDITAKNESILTSRQSRYLASIKANQDGKDTGFTTQELDDIDSYAQEMIDNPDFKISSVPSKLRASVIAKRNDLNGEKDTSAILETGGESFITWLKEDSNRTNFVKKEVADKGEYSSWFTPKGMDVSRVINSKEGQTAVQIAIEQGAKTNDEIYNKLFGDKGIMIEFVNEKTNTKKKTENSIQKSANSTPATI